MADANVILSLTIDSEEAERKIEELKKEIEKLKNTQKELDKAFVEGKKGIDGLAMTTEEYNKQTKENTKQIKANEQAIKSLTVATQSEEGSINSLREANKRLRQERDSLGDATGKNKDRIAELNKQINANDKIIRESSSSLEKNRLNIGNYSSALDGISGNLDKLIPGFKGMTDGVAGITAGARAFSATPFMAILSTISTVLPLIIGQFKKFAPLMDSIEDTVAAVSNTFKGLFENFDLLIKAISGSSEDWKKLGQAINETRAEGQRLLDVQRQLEDNYLDYQLRAAKSGPEIRRLLLEAKNRTLTEKERQDKLNQALEIEKDQREELIKLDQTAFENSVDSFVFENRKRIKSTEEEIKAINSKTNARIAQESRVASLSDKRRKQIEDEGKAEIARAKETSNLFDTISKLEDRYLILQELRKSGLFQEEDLKVAADAYVKYQQTIEGGISVQEKIQNTLDTLEDKRLENIKKANEEAEKLRLKNQQEAERLAELSRIQESYDQAERDRISALNEFRVNSEKSVKDNIKSIVQTNQDELVKIGKEANAQKAKDDKEYAQKVVRFETEKERQLASLRDQALSTVGQIFGKSKEVQVGLALISTYLSAQKAFESQFLPVADASSPIRGAAAASLAVIQGLGRVQALKSVSANGSGGGSSTIGGRSGITATQATTNPINQSFSTANAFKNMPPVVASWKEATEVRNRVEFKEALTTA